MQPPVEYVETQASDLGMGLRDAGKVSRHHPTDYGAGYGRPDGGMPEVAGYGRPEVAGYGGAPGYGAGMYEEVSYTANSLSDANSLIVALFSIRLCLLVSEKRKISVLTTVRLRCLNPVSEECSEALC